MENAIIAAIISALVALVGLLANLHVARATREAQRDIESFRSTLRLWQEAAEDVKQFMVSVENVRTRLNDLSKCLSRVLRAKEHMAENLVELENHQGQLAKACEDMNGTWCPVKADCADIDISYLRRTRHHALDRLQTITSNLATVIETFRMKRSVDEEQPISMLESLRITAEEGAQVLDTLIAASAAVRGSELLAMKAKESQGYSGGRGL